MTSKLVPSGALRLVAAGIAQAQSPSTVSVPVTPDNFVRAETDRAFGGEVKLGGLGKLRHHRQPIALDQQVVPRINRDTLYSSGVFDLDTGPVTITVPDAGRRFMSLIVIDEDHYVRGVYYGPGSHTLTRSEIGTRYGLAALRTPVDPDNPDDLKAVHALQDASKVEQPRGPGSSRFRTGILRARRRGATRRLRSTTRCRICGTPSEARPRSTRCGT